MLLSKTYFTFPEQPERIHFNISDDNITRQRFSNQNSSANTFSTVNIKTKSTPVNTTDSNHSLLLERRPDTVNTKWSIATDDNQNPQVYTVKLLYFD